MPRFSPANLTSKSDDDSCRYYEDDIAEAVLDRIV